MSEAPEGTLRIEEGALLLAVGQALSLTLPPEESMRRVAREVARAHRYQRRH